MGAATFWLKNNVLYRVQEFDIGFMKPVKEDSKLPKDIMDRINKGIEKEFEEEIKILESSVAEITLADMEKQVLIIRDKIGKIFMQKVVEARKQIGKKNPNIVEKQFQFK